MRVCVCVFTDVNELHQHWLQVTEGCSGLHAEAQLLLEVPTEVNLNANRQNR